MGKTPTTRESTATARQARKKTISKAAAAKPTVDERIAAGKEIARQYLAGNRAVRLEDAYLTKEPIEGKQVTGIGEAVRTIKSKEEDYLTNHVLDNYRVVDSVMKQLMKELGVRSIEWDRFADMAGANRVYGALKFNSVANSAFAADWSASTFDNVNAPFAFFPRCVEFGERARAKNPQYNCLLWM